MKVLVSQIRINKQADFMNTDYHRKITVCLSIKTEQNFHAR